ncbi:Rhodanese-related sulfurtransferase [Paenibacillus catalpae]|uniref:Rhodanese-related sulfurtransferase n=1 Tax=Paenibacillus catalpae TaxID=1045775 RepID=A0A1I1XND6_9BACL|nr:rhodanese-like domain-containing protein [Paenibacillus catalpae]SFE08865.1 Rhodanese-related sulfurtransferase [Paenibacillus catalpae]
MQSNQVRLQLPFEVKERLKRSEKFTILDVREQDEWESGHIPQAKHIPLGQLESRLNELDPNQETVVVCRSGGRSYVACEFLSAMNYNVINMPGGMTAWQGDIKQRK